MYAFYVYVSFEIYMQIFVVGYVMSMKMVNLFPVFYLYLYLQNRALQYYIGLHFRHSSFGGRLDSFVDLNLNKNRVSCVSLVDYPRAIRLESRVIC